MGINEGVMYASSGDPRSLNRDLGNQRLDKHGHFSVKNLLIRL